MEKSEMYRNVSFSIRNAPGAFTRILREAEKTFFPGKKDDREEPAVATQGSIEIHNFAVTATDALDTNTNIKNCHPRPAATQTQMEPVHNAAILPMTVSYGGPGGVEVCVRVSGGKILCQVEGGAREVRSDLAAAIKRLTRTVTVEERSRKGRR